LGWIPKGWEVVPLTDAIDFNPRVRLAKGETIKFVDMKTVQTSGVEEQRYGSRAAISRRVHSACWA